MDFYEKITPEIIVSGVASDLDDESFNQGVSKGKYLSNLWKSLEELSISMFMTTEAFDLDVPKNLKLNMPENTFNVREMYLHNGVCCQPGADMAIVHYKRRMNKIQGGDGYTANRKEEMSDDPFMNLYGSNNGPDFQFEGLYYGNVENGVIFLSSNCGRYKKLRVICNTMGVEPGTEPMVPRIVRECIELMVKKKVAAALMVRNPQKYTTIYRFVLQELDDPIDGVMAKTRSVLARMGTWKRNDFLENNGPAKY